MKEQVYDERIAPLMTQIIQICDSAKIALIADFGLDGDLHCTTSLLAPEFSPSQSQLRAHGLLMPQDSIALAETIETRPDGSKRITIRRIS